MYKLIAIIKYIIFILPLALLVSCNTEDNVSGGGKNEPFYSALIKEKSTEAIINTHMPLVIIETKNRIEPTCTPIYAPGDNYGASITNADYVEGNVAIVDADGVKYSSDNVDDVDEYGMKIRIRGNSSALKEKKPYKLKLSKAFDLLFRGHNEKYKDKEWLLLKYDNLNAFIGFYISTLMDMQWTPAFQYVNVILNGDFKGLYMLIESVKRNKECRINVDKTGYIFEYDPYWWNEDYCIKTFFSKKIGYTFKYPKDDDFTDEKRAYITKVLEQFEKVILEGGHYEDIIDVESFAKFLFIQDVIANSDGAGSNIYMTKEDDGCSKIEIGNLWDFDNIFAYDDEWSTIHIWDGCFFCYLLNNPNKYFLNSYISIWDNKGTMLFDQLKDIDERISKDELDALHQSLYLDENKWGKHWDSIEDRLVYVKKWFNKRRSFMKARMELIKENMDIQ